MNISVSKADLSRALQYVQSAVAKRTTMPILSNLLLSVSKKQLRVSASDLEISAVASCVAEERAAGSTTVSAKVFSDLVRELPEGEIKIALTEGERVEITAKGSKFKIIGVSAAEFPTLPGLSCETSSKVPANVLLEMVQRTIYAVSFDETRFNLNGVCFETVEGSKGKSSKKGDSSQLRLVATDGHRLALTTRPVNNFIIEGRVIVPRKALSEMRRVLEAEADKEVGVGVIDGFFVLEATDFKMASRLIESEYPEYSQVLPQKKGVCAVVASSDLAHSLRRVMLMVSDREKGVRLSFATGTLRIASSSPELGEAVEEVPLKYDGELLHIGFNATYLLDVASNVGDSTELVIELHGELGPGKFYAQNDESSVAIVMPMRL